SVISLKRDFIEEITGKIPLKSERCLDRISQTGSFLKSLVDYVNRIGVTAIFFKVRMTLPKNIHL
ncbi:hypothetical protein ABE096_06805, partial [Robertmurraya massiliosenegalensis]